MIEPIFIIVDEQVINISDIRRIVPNNSVEGYCNIYFKNNEGNCINIKGTPKGILENIKATRENIIFELVSKYMVIAQDNVRELAQHMSDSIKDINDSHNGLDYE